MSYNAKNLSYGNLKPVFLQMKSTQSLPNTESKDPPFLQKLRGEFSQGDPARQEHPIARPKRLKAADDEDDEPVYLQDDGKVILSNDQFKALLSTEGGTSDKVQQESSTAKDLKGPSSPSNRDEQGLDEKNSEKLPEKQPQAAIGASQKRRLAKVIGNIEEGVETERQVKTPHSAKTKRPKKGKRLKLSFDEDASGT